MLLTLVDEAVPQYGEEAVFAASGKHKHTEKEYMRFYNDMVERRAHPAGPAALTLAGMERALWAASYLKQAGKVGRCRLTPPRVDRAWFQRLKINCDDPLSSFAFNVNLRHYGEACKEYADLHDRLPVMGAGAYTRPLFGLT